MDPREIFKKVRQTETEKEFSFALEIGRGLVKGAIWAVDEGKAKVFSVSEVFRWEKETELVAAADKALSTAIEKADIYEKEEPKKVIFGLAYSWAKEEKIIPSRLSILKKLCHDLDLKPVGFVVTTEAIVKYLKTLEGVPPNAILVNMTLREVQVVLLRLGKVLGTALVKRSDNLGEDIAEGLSRIKTKEVLPARIILYDSEEVIEERKEEVLSYPWLKKENGFNFIHLPKAEVAGFDFDIKAVALAGGAEVAKAEGVEAEIFLEEKPEEEKEVSSEPGVEDEKKEEELGFGFTEREIEREPVERSEKSFGRRFKKPRLGTNLGLALSFFKRAFSFRDYFRKLPFLGIILGGLFLLLTGGLVWFWWFFPKAEVVFFVEPQVLEREFEITLDSTAQETNLAEMIIPAERKEVTVEGVEELETTGVKLIGEEAKGEVTIYNRTLEEKTLPGGTVLVGPGGLEFSLDEEVVVASESAGPDYTKVPGKAKVRATALAIGPESNLASETEFEISRYSVGDLVARNSDVFSGGTSREVRVVAKDDQDGLYSSLLEKLRSQAGDRLGEGVSSGKVLVLESLVEEVLTKGFDKDLEEEAERLKLDLSVAFKALVYEKSKFNSLVREKIKTAVSSGFEFKEEETEVSFELGEVIDEERVVFNAFFEAKLWPRLEIDQIRENLRGKKPELGESYLSGLPNLAGYEVSFTPDLPKKIKTFPKVLENISIEVKSVRP